MEPTLLEKLSVGVKGFNTTIVSVEQDKLISGIMSVFGFQYNYCFGGTIKKGDKIAQILLFQYNYCFGGTLILVLISLVFSCFNTTIVSVEHGSQGFNLYSLTKFQYNYCFGGTYKKIKNSFPVILFQYNYCFGGTDWHYIIKE